MQIIFLCIFTDKKQVMLPPTVFFLFKISQIPLTSLRVTFINSNILASKRLSLLWKTIKKSALELSFDTMVAIMNTNIPVCLSCFLRFIMPKIVILKNIIFTTMLLTGLFQLKCLCAALKVSQITFCVGHSNYSNKCRLQNVKFLDYSQARDLIHTTVC